MKSAIDLADSASEAIALKAFQHLDEFQHATSDQSFTYYNSLITIGQFRPLFSRIKALFPVSSRILDWGCGDGHISFHLLDSGHRCTSYSLQPKPAFLSRLNEEQKSRHQFTQGSVEDPVSIPYADNTFDGVLSCGVLEHVREGGGDELKSLLEIKRILKPGGYFICAAFPNKFGYIQNINLLLFGWKYRKIPYTVKYHKYTFSKKEVMRLCNSAGMEVVDYRNYAFLPRNIFLRFPKAIRRSEKVARAVNRLDGILAGIFSLFCTSHLFVLKK